MCTAKELQAAFYYANWQRFEIIAPNIYLDWQFNEMDLLCLRKSGYVDEVEVKLTKQDFLADFRKTVKVKGDLIKTHWGSEYHEYVDKPKHELLAEGVPHCNRFSFLVPDELKEKIEIPDYAGLYVFKNGRVHELKAATLLHKRKISTEHKLQIGRKMAYRYWNAA